MTMRRRTATSGGHATIRRYTRRPERAPRAELPLSGVFRYTCLTSLSLKVVADYDDVAGPSDWHRTPGPAYVGARGVPGQADARMRSVHAREGGGKTLRCAHKTVAHRQPPNFHFILGALPHVAAKRLYLFVRHGRKPNAVASARSATARARASAPAAGRPGSTSKARQGESDHAIADTAPHRRQRRVDAESTTGLRSQQLGQTAYFPSSAAGAASSGLRRTRDHMGGRSGRICRKARGTRSRRLFTSSTVSPGVSSTTRYHAPRRSGQSIPARTRAQYCTCGMRALRATVDLRIQGVRAPGGRACHIMSAAGGLGL